MDFSNSQKNTVIYLTIVLGLAIVIIGIISNAWLINSLPSQPSLTVDKERTAQMVKDDIDNYKNMIAVLKDRSGVLNDLLVVKFLKGLFDSLLVAIISYVFGKPLVVALAARITGNKGKSI
jgi:ABC-type glycerol-3-phosphate transport system permease component